MDTFSEISIRITEAYLARVNLNVIVGPSPGEHTAQGKKLGELYAAVYKVIAQEVAQ